MTTIAWDGVTVACDSQTTGGDSTKSFDTKKMVWNKRFIYVRCGAACYSVLVSDWFLAGADYEHAPNITTEGPVGVGFCRLTGAVWLFEGPTLARIAWKTKRWAIGGGASFAIGAMAAGKTPAQAVAIASKFDLYTGGKIHSVRIRG